MKMVIAFVLCLFAVGCTTAGDREQWVSDYFKTGSNQTAGDSDFVSGEVGPTGSDTE